MSWFPARISLVSSFRARSSTGMGPAAEPRDHSCSLAWSALLLGNSLLILRDHPAATGTEQNPKKGRRRRHQRQQSSTSKAVLPEKTCTVERHCRAPSVPSPRSDADRKDTGFGIGVSARVASCELKAYHSITGTRLPQHVASKYLLTRLPVRALVDKLSTVRDPSCASSTGTGPGVP